MSSVEWCHKGASPDIAMGDAGHAALDDSAATPLALLRDGALRHNLAVMRDYCHAHGVELAPHGKTTMSPELIGRQLAHGAWAITAATPWQARVLRSFAVPRILLANEFVDPGGLRWTARELRDDPAFDFLCYVDSVDGVRIMAEALAGVPGGAPLDVLLELGVDDGRAGCRDDADVTAVADAVAATPHLRLRGVAAFEGILGGDRGPAAIGRVDALLTRVRALTERLAAQARFAEGPVIVSAGGSAYFDRVVALLAQDWPTTLPVQTVLRSGCYLTHDHGAYAAVSPLAGGAGPVLQPALEVWGRVLSRPEPTLAIVDVGRRDVSHDAGMPTPLRVRRRGSAAPERVEGWTTAGLNDQHAYLRITEPSAVAVADLVGFGVSHPCTTFDKWRLLHVVDDEYRIIDAVHTFF